MPGCEARHTRSMALNARYMQHVFGELQKLDVSNCHCDGNAPIGPNTRFSSHSASKLALLVK